MKSTYLLFAIILGLVLVSACAPRADSPQPQASTDITPTLEAQPSTNATATLAPRQQITPVVTISAGDVVDALLNQDFALGVGQTGIVTDTPDQFGITFYHVEQDSRCPKSVQCFVAGEVVAQITFQENGLMHPPILEVTTKPNSPNHKIRIEDYFVELVDVQPPRLTLDPIPPEDYIGIFRVTLAASDTATPTASAQATALPPAAGTLDQPIVIKMFQPVQFPEADMVVTMNGVFEDSRCPKQVDCVQAGRALISFQLARDGQIGSLVLSTMPPDGSTTGYFQGYAIDMTDVQPYPETPDQKIRPTDYSATITVRKAEPPTTVNKNQGFVLKPGQTATIADENVQVTFERVASDSRCPYMVTCAVRGNAVVETTLTLPDGTKQTFVLNTDSGAENKRIPDTGRFGLELVNLNPYPQVDSPRPDEMQDQYEATFVLKKFATDVQPKTPPAQPVACLGLTAPDAEAILGEPVEPEPLTDVRLYVEPFDDDSQRESEGVCGFVSVSATEHAPVAGEPRLSQSARHVVTAARLQGAEALELLRVANLIRGSAPDRDSTSYLILLTRLTAGDWAGLLNSFRALPRHPANIHFEGVDSFGDEGLWIWRQAKDDNYAALLVRDNNSFILIEALTDKRITQAAAKESIHAAMAKAIQ